MDVAEIDVTEFAALHAQGVTVIDVRNPDEYEGAHVPGAVLIPLPELADRVAEVPTDAPLYLICAMGGRSRRAGEFLGGRGLEVTNIAGGTNAWIDAGYATTEGDAP